MIFKRLQIKVFCQTLIPFRTLPLLHQTDGLLFALSTICLLKLQEITLHRLPLHRFHPTDTRQRKARDRSLSHKLRLAVGRNNGRKAPQRSQQPLHSGKKHAIRQRGSMACHAASGIGIWQRINEKRRIADNAVKPFGTFKLLQ